MTEYTELGSHEATGGLKVMVCVDGSHNSELAFQYYLDHVHKNGNEIVLVHVADLEIYPSSHIYSGGMGIGMPTGTTHEILDKAKKKNKIIETKFTTKCEDLGLHYTFLALLEGGHGLGAVLVQAAHDHNI
uniref:uncharacterized protein LOC120341326 n=1 Tax=Styela clava TaxID=7725 RepID=UPI00193A7929|nr:uncharacterized protein LOC120341326 [Styela clava]